MTFGRMPSGKDAACSPDAAAQQLPHQCRFGGWNGAVPDMDAAAALLRRSDGLGSCVCGQSAVCCMRHAGLHEGKPPSNITTSCTVRFIVSFEPGHMIAKHS